MYSLIRPPRTGFRRICCLSMSVRVARAVSGSSSGTAGLCPGAAGRCCSAPDTQSGPSADAARRGSAPGRGDRGAGCRPGARRSRWTTPSTTPCPDDRYRRVRVTHRFHPLSGRDFEFVAHRHNWGEDRVHLHDENGVLFSLPAGWTDVAPADPFVVIADGRCPFTTGGLLALFAEPLAPGSRWPTVPPAPGRSPGGRRSGPRMAHRICRQWREPCSYRGIALDGAGTVPPGAVARPLRCHARTAGGPRQPWPAWPVECGGWPWMDRLLASRCRGSSAGLLLTCDVPAVDLS